MKRLNTILLLLVLAAAAVFALGGCSSDDPVTPNDQLEVTAEDAAYQAGFVAMAMVDVLEELSSKAVPQVQTVNRDCVFGAYMKDSDPDHVYTDADHVLTIDFDCDGVADDENNGVLTFDITSVADVANGSGALVIDTLNITLTVADVELDPGNYPVGGQLTIESSGHTAVVDFYPDHSATVTVDGTVWNVDLEDGSITAV